MFKTAIAVLALALSLTAATLPLTDGPVPECDSSCDAPPK
jgi:hypothetical protein